MKQQNKKLNLKSFAELFGAKVSNLPAECKRMINQFDTSYRFLNQKERDKIIIQILQKIHSPDLSISGKNQNQRWEKGWSENLQEFINSNYNIKKLIPKYFRAKYPVRLNGDYVIPRDPNFEIHWCNIFRKWLYSKYFNQVDEIYDFGTGTGINLIELSQIFPKKQLHGLDWTKSSIKIIQLLNTKVGLKTKGHLFNMFEPDQNLKLDQNSGILAFGALEQLGENFDPFLEFILKKMPKIVIIVNAFVELYDKNNLADYLAILFNQKRGYLDGFLLRIKELKKQGRIKIHKIQKVPFGSLYIDGFSYIIFSPC